MVEIREACEQRFVNFVYVDKENEGIIKTLYQFLSVNPDYGLVVGGNKLIDSDSQLFLGCRA